MREGPVLRLAMEVALLASRGQPYLIALEQGVSSVFGIETGIGLITWKRPDGPGATRADLSVVGGKSRWSRQQLADAAEVAPRHPNYDVLWQIGTTYPVRTSDHVTLSEFWPTDVWRDQHGHCDGRYPVGFAVRCVPPTEVTFIGMHRSDHDFSDEEVSAMSAIQSLLTPALQFRSGLDDAASRLLTTAKVDPATESYRPSRREAEVLALVTLGWTNDRIGRQLGITERTVRKHLGAVYNKAGVPGRAAAACWWQALRSRFLHSPPDAG